MSSPHSPLSGPTSLRLLVVEDDPEVGERLHAYFTDRGQHVTRVADGTAALDQMTALPPYDVVLLALTLPGKDGFEVLREARAAGVDSPVILLAARSENEHKLRGFDLGADDYVTKPFDPAELAARVQAVHHRSQDASHPVDDTFSFGDVTVDLAGRTAARGERSLEFTDLEFDILAYFIEHRGRTVSRKQLLRDVWGISGNITTRTVDRHVASLRKKVEPNRDDPEYIKTIYGVGYKFAA